MLLRAITALALFAGIGQAHAQATTITPWLNGYMVNTPGSQQPVVIQPWLNGYTYGQIGGQQTTVQPFNNGWIVNQPIGQQPLQLVPLPGMP